MVKDENYFEKKTIESTTRFVAIDKLTDEILSDFERQFKSSNIRVDKDLPNLEANVYPLFIHAAVYQLIQNAIQQMPTGGELNVTLIESDRCWELEVADSSLDSASSQNLRHRPANTKLPTLVGMEASPKLELAHRAASVHGGHMQSWDCPQGGKAHVLIIPRHQQA